MSKLVFVVEDPTTEIGTGLNGTNITVKFKDGRFETDDIALANLLMDIGIALEERKESP